MIPSTHGEKDYFANHRRMLSFARTRTAYCDEHGELSNEFSDDLGFYLDRIMMTQHRNTLAKHGFSTLDILEHTNVEDLEEIGLLKGHAVRIIRTLEQEMLGHDSFRTRQKNEACDGGAASGDSPFAESDSLPQMKVWPINYLKPQVHPTKVKKYTPCAWYIREMIKGTPFNMINSRIKMMFEAAKLPLVKTLRSDAQATDIDHCYKRWNGVLKYWKEGEPRGGPLRNLLKGKKSGSEEELKTMLEYLGKVSGTWSQSNVNRGRWLRPEELDTTLKTVWEKHTVDGQQTSGREGARERNGKQVFLPNSGMSKSAMIRRFERLLKDAIVGTLHSGATLVEKCYFAPDAFRSGGWHWRITARSNDTPGYCFYNSDEVQVPTYYYSIVIKIGRTYNISGMWPVEEPKCSAVENAYFPKIYHVAYNTV